MSDPNSTTSVEPLDPIDSDHGGAEARAEYVKGLRDLADFLAEHPEIHFYTTGAGGLTVLWYCTDQEGLAAAARTLGRAEKRPDDTYLNLDRSFGPHKLQAYASHTEVCERVVVGIETVTTPAIEAVPEQVEEREIVEWRCPPSLLAAIPVTPEEDAAWDGRTSSYGTGMDGS